MRIIIKCLTLFIAIVLGGCSSKNPTPAQLRFGQFMLARDSVHLTIAQNDEVIWKDNLYYSTLTQYKPLNPGKYTISVTRGEKTVLKEKFGLGKNQSFTLCAFGIPDTNLETNYRTFEATMHQVFAGSEAHTPNGEKPKVKMLVDNFQKGEKEAQIRWAHLAPGLKSISAEAYNISTGKSAGLGEAKYPEVVENKVLKPGKYIIRWRFKGGPQTVAQQSIEIDPELIYSFFVIGQPAHYPDSLKVVVGAHRINELRPGL